MKKEAVISTFAKEIDIKVDDVSSLKSAVNLINKSLSTRTILKSDLELILDKVISLTDSYSGAILTVNKSNSSFVNSVNQELHHVYSKENKAIANSTAIHQWFQEQTPLINSAVFNGEIPDSHTSLLNCSEDISSLIISPNTNNNQLIGVCLLYKKQGVYSEHITHSIIPALCSAFSALKSVDELMGENFLDSNSQDSENNLLNLLLSTSPTAILVINKDKRIVVSNPASNRIFNHSSEMFPQIENNAELSLIDRKIDDFIPKFTELLTQSYKNNQGKENALSSQPYILENQTFFRTNGEQFLGNISAFQHIYKKQHHIVVQIQDVTTITNTAEEYQQTSQQLNALTHLVPLGIIHVNTGWECIYANDKWYELSGLIQEESHGSGWINSLHSDDVENTLEQLRESLRLGCGFQAEIRLESALGQTRWVDFNTQVLFDGNGFVQGFLGTFTDITEHLRSKERLRNVAEYDALTGLANRNLLQDKLQEAFYQSDIDKSDVSIFFIDLDGFKDINDSLGHDIGDKLLQQVAERLLKTLHKNDTVARFGGDEFVILLSSTTPQNNLSLVANRVIDAVAEPYHIDGNDIYITASLGVATGKGSNSSPKNILKHADAALYLAKSEGKNNFQFFKDELHIEVNNRVHLTNQLRNAFTNERFYLVYQPLAFSKDKKVFGFEALLRVTDDEDKIMLPNDFIHILETSGMIIDVGKWIIKQACKQLRLWKNQNLFPEDGYLSINVSPKQLLDDSIIPTIVDACQLYQIKPQHIVLEITESVIIDKPLKAEAVMNELKKIGVKFALDDFGTGYSSLTYLQRYPFDQIKIDRSFISNICTNPNDAKITQAIITLAKSLGLKITSEGVEDVDALHVLNDYGSDYFQGYYLGKPVLPHEAIKFLN